MTDDTRALIDQTDDFRRRGMDGAVASNERVLAGRVPALLDRIATLEAAAKEARSVLVVDSGELEAAALRAIAMETADE